MAGGQHPLDLYALADLGSQVKVLIEELDAGRIDGERFVAEVRGAMARVEEVLREDEGRGRG